MANRFTPTMARVRVVRTRTAAVADYWARTRAGKLCLRVPWQATFSTAEQESITRRRRRTSRARDGYPAERPTPARAKITRASTCKARLGSLLHSPGDMWAARNER